MQVDIDTLNEQRAKSMDSALAISGGPITDEDILTWSSEAEGGGVMAGVESGSTTTTSIEATGFSFLTGGQT